VARRKVFHLRVVRRSDEKKPVRLYTGDRNWIDLTSADAVWLGCTLIRKVTRFPSTSRSAARHGGPLGFAKRRPSYY
jgi:hypothetical protein